MSFFKKLFNRITGKTEAPAPAPEAPLPAAEPEAAVAPQPPEPEPASSSIVDIVAPEPEPALAPPEAAAPPPEPDAEPTPPPAAEPDIGMEPEFHAPRPKARPKAPAKKPPLAKRVAEPVSVPVPGLDAMPVPRLEPDLEPEPPEEVLAPEPASAVAPFPAAEESQAGRWLQRLRDGLSKSSKNLGGSITAIFTKRKLDRTTLGELEDTLIQSDLGIGLAERIVAAVAQGRYDKEIEPDEVRRILADEVARVLEPVEVPFTFGAEKPYVILVVGVNGSGKTTTIGKLGAIASREGFTVMLAACDTFRAAAIEQLTIWGSRIGARTMSRPTGADAAGLAFDALKAARAEGIDILFIDTAGRLQNKANLMEELGKIVRVLKKQDETAPHAVLLVLDATTGQNAIAQADVFSKVAGVTGLIMTKLDGTARGGILAAIAEKFRLPVHAIGVGEGIDDLQPFDARAFARAIAGLER